MLNNRTNVEAVETVYYPKGKNTAVKNMMSTVSTTVSVKP